MRPVKGKPFVSSFYFWFCVIVYEEWDGEVLLFLGLNLFGQVTHL